MSLPPPPVEVPAESTSVGSAPLFAAAVNEMLAALAGGLSERPFEWLRTPERQRFLFGFGRDYDDGRGIVTSAKTALYSHHGFGCGVDIVQKDGTPWDAPEQFWESIALAAEATGKLKSGYRWHKKDRPHVYWSQMPDDLHGATGDSLRALYAADGITAIWQHVRAV